MHLNTGLVSGGGRSWIDAGRGGRRGGGGSVSRARTWGHCLASSSKPTNRLTHKFLASPTYTHTLAYTHTTISNQVENQKSKPNPIVGSVSSSLLLFPVYASKPARQLNMKTRIIYRNGGNVVLMLVRRRLLHSNPLDFSRWTMALH